MILHKTKNTSTRRRTSPLYSKLKLWTAYKRASYQTLLLWLKLLKLNHDINLIVK